MDAMWGGPVAFVYPADRVLCVRGQTRYSCTAQQIADLVVGGGASWGVITGTLSAQTDLQSALDGKSDVSHTHAIGDSTGLQAALDAKAATSHAHSISDTTGLQTALDGKEPALGFTAVPNTRTVAGKALSANITLVKADVGLGSVDNTADSAKPVSTAQQTALDAKAPLASPTVTGAVNINATTLGFYGVALVARPSAYTQTYSTASKTHAAVTQLAAPAGGVGVAAGAWSTAANRDLAIASINAARTDIANVKNTLNSVIDDLQALGLLQ